MISTVVLGNQPAMLRGRTVLGVPPCWPVKDPVSTVARGVDFGALLGGRTPSGLSAAAAGAVVAGQSFSGSVASLILQGGTDGIPARVELRLLCSDGTDETAAIVQPMRANITLLQGEAMPVTLSASSADATPCVLGPLPVIAVPGVSVSIRGRCVARNTASGDTVSWDVAAVVKGFGTPGAVVEQQGVTIYSADPSLTGCTLAVSASGGSIWLVGVGVLGATLAWSADLDRTVA